ncbi:MAG: UDP-2,3-diacylglucosamine diphosphatase [Proteobacteria bacterium]|nr:UDP-2,3-diacylglucosamine diphosphatase [Pseudomonadota bacterium]
MNGSIPIFQYKVVFISDIHLGSNKTAAPYLYEFLKHLDYDYLDEIYLVGDIIGGWERQSAKQQPAPEMERRIIDCINYAAAKGKKINILPGNHDEKLRPRLDALNARRHFDVFGPTISFMNEAYYKTTGSDPKTFKVVHGDEHDPELFVKPFFKPVVYAVSAAYDWLVALNYYYSRFMYERFGVHSSFAQPMKSNFKRIVGYVFSHKSLLRGLQEKQFDGEIFGHIHTPGRQIFNEDGRFTYLINTGDWVENATAVVVKDRSDIPEVLDYKVERERVGFGELPDIDDPHPAKFAAMRPQTDRQMRLVHRLWPARNRRHQFQKLKHESAKIRSYEIDKMALAAVMRHLRSEQCLGEIERASLQDIVDRTRKESYAGQKKGLARIFSKYAANEVMDAEDALFLQIVVREFSTRADRKIRKHKKELDKITYKLDFRTASKRAPVESEDPDEADRLFYIPCMPRDKRAQVQVLGAG